MWRQVVAQSPGTHAPTSEIDRYDAGWKALNTMLKSGRSLSGHERNCVFLNTQDGPFADISGATGLDFIDDGRVVALTDWDQDGDLDFWITNRSSPQVRFLRNNTDGDAKFIAFKLTGTTCNRDAVGARIELGLSDGSLRAGAVRSGEGYLAQSSQWVHFGLGSGEPLIERITVRWPGGAAESIPPVEPGRRYAITQGTGAAEPWQPPARIVQLAAEDVKPPPFTEAARIVLVNPVPVPAMKFTNAAGEELPVTSPSGRPRLVNLWASWCAPCIDELKDWKAHHAEIARRGLEVLTIAVDHETGRQEIDALLAQLDLPFMTGYGTEALNAQFDILQRAILHRQRPLPVPSSFLVDGAGNLRVIYKGTVSASRLIADASLASATPEVATAMAVPFPGKWLDQPDGSSPNSIAAKFAEGGFYTEAAAYLQQLVADPDPSPVFNRGNAFALLGALLVDQGRLQESAAAFEESIAIDPDYRLSRMLLAEVLVKLNRPGDAVPHYLKALSKRPDDPELRFNLGMAHIQSGSIELGIPELEESIALRPSPLAHCDLGNAYLNQGQIGPAIAQFEAAVALDPGFIPAANNLAWFRATHPDASIRDGQRAVVLAEGVCEDGAARNAANLDTLAAAYAEAGRFDNAMETAKEAIGLAKAAGDLQTSRAVEQRLALYEQGEAYRDGQQP